MIESDVLMSFSFYGITFKIYQHSIDNNRNQEIKSGQHCLGVAAWQILMFVFIEVRIVLNKSAKWHSQTY